MSDNFIRRFPHTAVYWGTPTNDGDGGYTFADPIEITCRWEATGLVNFQYNGVEVQAKHEVYVDRDVDEEGYLFLGELDDIDSDLMDTPIDLEGAEMIVRFDKIPNMAGTKYTRKAFLGKENTGMAR
jgi:hypothetical protein